MLVSAEHRAGEPRVVAFGARPDEGGGLFVGLLLVAPHAPVVVTLGGRRYGLPPAYLENPAPLQARNITLEPQEEE